MKFNRFYVHVLIRALLLFCTIFIFAWSLNQEHLVIAKFTFFSLSIIIFLSLVTYVTRTNRQLSTFLNSLIHSDSVRGSGLNDPSFKKLDLTYSKIEEIIQDTKMEREAEHLYFQYTVEHADVGLMSVQSSGRIEFINPKGLSLLGLSEIQDFYELDKIKPSMVAELGKLEPGQHKTISLKIDGALLLLSFSVKEIKVKENSIRIYSFQNIRTELENEELEAWQKLIKVLRHEIMNSITPVKSLSYSILKSFDGIRKNDYVIDNKDQMNKVFDGMHAIHNRSLGMMKFIESYREVTKMPEPDFYEIELCDLVKKNLELLDEEFKRRKINLKVSAQQSCRLLVDEKLISQVLINIIKNAFEALEGIDEPSVEIGVLLNEKYTEVQIKDNGCGMSDEVQQNIFVPFFTTKDNGSGIGLSLSREIIRKHKGTIVIESEENKGTQVRIRL